MATDPPVPETPGLPADARVTGSAEAAPVPAPSPEPPGAADRGARAPSTEALDRLESELAALEAELAELEATDGGEA